MKIRKATIEDVNIIAKYNYNLALETEEKVLNMDTVTKGVEAILRDSTKGIYHVCEIEGQVVGQIMYTFEWSDWRNGTFLWIQSVYVDKKFRGKGIFKNLYKYIKDICDNDKDICGIRLYVEKENYVAQKTYKNIGIDKIEKELSIYNFFRCHKSFLVNISYIENIKQYIAILENKDEVPISRYRFKETKARFLSYIGSVL